MAVVCEACKDNIIWGPNSPNGDGLCKSCEYAGMVWAAKQARRQSEARLSDADMERDTAAVLELGMDWETVRSLTPDKVATLLNNQRAEKARRARIEQEAIASYVKASDCSTMPFAKLELSVEPKRDGDPAIQVHVDDKFFMGFNGNANEDDPLISEHTGCKVQGPVVQPNVLGSNVTLGNGFMTLTNPEAPLGNETKAPNDPFYIKHRNEWR